MSLNKVMLIGNVGNDPEVRYLENNPQSSGPNPKVATFRIATTERYTDRSGNRQENTEWHSIVAWRNSADFAEKFIHKGSQVFVEGRLRTRQWTDQAGANRYTTEVVVDNIQLLGKRPDSQNGVQPAVGSQQAYSQPAAPQGFAQAPQQGYAQQPRPAAPAYQPAPVTPAPTYQPAAAAPAAPAPAAEDVPTDDLPF